MKQLKSEHIKFIELLLSNNKLMEYIASERCTTKINVFNYLQSINRNKKYDTSDAYVLNQYGTFYTTYITQ